MKKKLKTTKYLYRQIKNYIIHEITSGNIKPDKRLASIRKLSEDFGVSDITVRRAVQEL